MTGITLTSAFRSNLIELNKVRKIEDSENKKLANGKSVSDATDNALIFFRSRNLTEQSRNFLEGRDNLKNGLNVAKTTLESLASIDNLLKQVKGITLSVVSQNDEQRAQSSSDLKLIINQATQIARDSEVLGANLLSSTNNYVVSFASNNGGDITLKARDLASEFGSFAFSKIGFAGFSAVGNGANLGKILNNITNVFDSAISSIRSYSNELGSKAAIIDTRLQFTDRFVSRLNQGNDDLLLNDNNESAVNLLSAKDRTGLIFDNFNKLQEQQNAYINTIARLRQNLFR